MNLETERKNSESELINSGKTWSGSFNNNKLKFRFFNSAVSRNLEIQRGPS